ncbi:hypothetical protein [Amycolatopsis echigonensis]|uniref:Integrase n=1 Tax=Amycolatopsis echigonensis TaxID=2576905 RepID=A0A8E1WA78_9PSEU|nr:hypothetical protein [Amycolatopsis echigonensis]MBB2506383.1 hypothetical protein [Amycolatopsis echigonensis]
MTTAISTRRAPHPIPADTLVLREQQLLDEVDLADTSRFGDMIWDLRPVNHQAHRRRFILNFPTLPEPYQQVAKELFFALLAGESPAGEARPKLGTLRGLFTQVKKFLAWADARGRRSLTEMNTDDLAAYQTWLLKQDLGPGQRGAHRRAARLFWLYRAVLHSDRLELDPQRLESWSTDNSKVTTGLENRTDRIPEQVISPLLIWALRWVRDYSADLLAARDEWRPLHNQGKENHPTSTRHTRAETKAAFERLLKDYRAAGRPLPGTGDGQINEKFLARQINRHHSSMRYPTTHAMLTAATAELGVAEDTYLFTPAQQHPHGTPWKTAFRFAEVERWSRLLQTACYIVIAYLSGMRDSEVKHLRRGCISHRFDRDDRIARRTITSLAFKGEHSPLGTAATWVVSDSVDLAVTVLEHLQEPDATYLFAPLPGSPGYRGTDRSSTTSTTNKALNAFVDWINEHCANHNRPDGVPLVRRQRWTLSTSQFRRTLAWFIARRPGGTIAGAIQYRHHSIQMFEGYAGTSDSGFRAEVEAERTLERGERLLAMIEGHEHLDLRGPAAGEAQTRLANLDRKIAYAGSVVTDPKRLAKIMRRDDPKIYFGQFVTCVYDPNKALCRRQLATDDAAAMPDLGTCQPLRCRNVALTDANLDALTDQLTKLDNLLHVGDALAPYVAHRLTEQYQDLTAMLTAAGHLQADQ